MLLFFILLGGFGGRGGRGTPRGRGGTPGGGRGDRPPNSTLMVFGLNKDTEPFELQNVFTDSNDVYLPKDRETGEKRGSVK